MVTPLEKRKAQLATPAVGAGSWSDNFVAAGPETFTFEELLRLLAKAVNARVRLVHTPPSLGFALTRLLGLLPRDVVLTWDEVDGLMAGLLTSHAAPAGTTRLAVGSKITRTPWDGSTCPNSGATTGVNRRL